MLKNFFIEKPTDVDELIDSVELALKQVSPDSKEYSAILGHLTRLYELKAGNGRKPVSSDTIAICVMSITELGFLHLIENTNIVNSLGHRLRIRPKGL